MVTSAGRHGIGLSWTVAIATIVLAGPPLPAQTMLREPDPVVDALMAPAPLPADVLTPNKRQNTPYLKIGVRAGLNWAAYSNDRYLDNTALDVGQTSGEIDVYSNASDFGFGGGLELEYPLNTGVSIVGTAEFARARFGSEGPVEQPCVSSDGRPGTGVARHAWSASLDYLKIGGIVKLAFPSFYVLGGLTAGSLLGSTVERTREFDSEGCRFVESPTEHSIVERGELSGPAGLHWSFRTGFGLVYPIADGLQFSPELTLDFGLGSINKSPESDLDIYTVSAVLRYELR